MYMPRMMVSVAASLVLLPVVAFAQNIERWRCDPDEGDARTQGTGRDRISARHGTV
jgi:hypothetical protein